MLCEVCNKREHTRLCDYATGTGVVTSVNFQELTITCDKKMCKECAVSLWANCEVCPDHAVQVKGKLLQE
ncbi:hypothetical protein EEL32_11355 [Brevibacillus laterosporus]|uniref:Uncharacterized protein n=1 Tax=Brevibacillus laterosporus TaxID=1465 RepID=A0A502H5H3_BRELA|nr:hypothetical protein EEL30_26105 [Brevibacillus laterosporus]TPG69354.1 hypothetical protein EEL31_13065 [Brevibacillus laterosporus]TPG87795.1 hypothetical protein EEL32_11355 [Brevibacillus laterosporus]